MAQAILRPSAIGTYDFWTLGAGGSKPVAVDPGDPVSHDADTTFINIGTAPGANNQQSFYLNTGLPGDIAGVNSIDMHSRARTTGTPGVESWAHFIRRASTDGAAPTAVMGAAYADFDSASYARPGGGSWVPGDFVSNNIQGGVGVGAASAQPCRVTSIWAVLDYQPAAAGFAVFVASLIGVTLGSGLLLSDMPGIAAHLARVTHGDQRLVPSDYPVLLEGLRLPRRVYAWR